VVKKVFQKNYDNNSASNFYFRLGPSNKLSNFDLYNNFVKIKYFLTFEYAAALTKGYKTLVYMKKLCQMAV
jgi:hypothetical protein